MIVCDVISALLYATLAIAAWLGLLTTGQVVVVALLAGTANVFFATAYQVCLPELVTTAELVAGRRQAAGGASLAAMAAAPWRAWRPTRWAPPPLCCSTRPASPCRPPACWPSARRLARAG